MARGRRSIDNDARSKQDLLHYDGHSVKPGVTSGRRTAAARKRRRNGTRAVADTVYAYNHGALEALKRNLDVAPIPPRRPFERQEYHTADVPLAAKLTRAQRRRLREIAGDA